MHFANKKRRYHYPNSRLGLSGSYTVEASFIVPIVLGIIFTMILMLFYLHDRVILYANIKEKTVEVAQEMKSYSSSKAWQRDMQSKLWMMNVEGGNISDKKISVNASVSAVKHIALPLISRYMNTDLKLAYKIKYMKIHPESVIRTKEIIGDNKEKTHDIQEN